MAQLERIRSFAKHSKDAEDKIEQLRDHNSQLTTPTTPTLGKNHDQEEDHHEPLHVKKSVLTKVKEKAKKWRHALVHKKMHTHHDNNNNNNNSSSSATPAWGVSLDDDDADDDDGGEDSEYLGAPMYESELAPDHQGYNKETASNQHQSRMGPVVSDKHVMASNNITVSSSSNPKGHQEKEIPAPTKTIIESAVTKKKFAPANANVPLKDHQEKEIPAPSKTTTESTVTHKKPASTNAKVPGVTQAVAPKIQNASTMQTSKTESVREKKPVPANAKVPEATQVVASKIQTASTMETSKAPIKRDEMSSSTGEHKWDKGVSVKEYLMQKLEPGEEERALSEVISDAISPKTIIGDTGVVEKVREAVSSMLGIEQSTSLPTTTRKTSTEIPLSTNAQEVIVEENQERILQAN